MKALRQFGFNAGEWDPRLAIRSDLDKYHYACTVLENFDPDAGGSVSRRRGLELVGTYNPGTGKKVLAANAESMLFDGKSKYLIAFLSIGDSIGAFIETRGVVYNLAINAYCGEFVLHSGGGVAMDLKSLRVRQTQDVLFVVHPSMPPKEILRDLDEDGNYTFSVRDFEFSCPAMLASEETSHEIKFTPKEASDEFDIGCYTEGYITSENLPAGIVTGDTIALETDTEQTLYKDWGSETTLRTSEAIPAIGTVSLETGGGRWAGELAIEVSYDFGATWAVLSSVVAPDDGSLNPKTSVTIEDFGAWVRVRLLRRTKAVYWESVDASAPKELDYGCKWWLKTSGTQTYYYHVQSVIEANKKLEVRCLNGSPKSVSSKFYQLNAWSLEKGYPYCVEIAQERLWFLGNNSQPKTVWGSQINNLKNFCTGTLATSAVSFVPSTNVYDRSIWFKWGHDIFMVGGTMSEMSMGSGSSSNSTISATSISMSNQTAWGSANVDAVNAGDKLFYAKSGGEILNAQIYNFGSNSYTSSAVNSFSKHLFSGGNTITKIAYSRNPHSALFVLGAKGEIARFVFSQEDNVAAWSRYQLAPKIQCLSITTMQEDDTDVLACVVIDGNDGNQCKIGKINFKSDVYSDFGYDYTSTLVAMPMDIADGHVRGARVILSGVDIYGRGLGDFEVSFDGGETYNQQFAGFDVSGSNLFLSGKVECEWNGDYNDIAQLAIRTQCHSEFTLMGYGADVRISDR